MTMIKIQKLQRNSMHRFKINFIMQLLGKQQRRLYMIALIETKTTHEFNDA